MAAELSIKLKSALGRESGLQRQVGDLGDQLSYEVGKKDSAELRMHRMEADLRERDKLEAARDSLDQSKAYTEERVAKMEAKLLSLHRTKESLKAALARRDGEYRELFNEKGKALKEVEGLRVEMSMMRVRVEDSGITICSLEGKIQALEEEATQTGLAFVQVSIPLNPLFVCYTYVLNPSSGRGLWHTYT